MNRSILVAPVFLVSCEASLSGPPFSGDDGPPDPPPDADTAFPALEACPPMFRQEILPEYHVEISADEWAKLTDEFLHVEDRLDAGLEEHPYHPAELEYVVGDVRERPAAPVLIRLKGQSSWRHSVELDDPPKMQFVVAFNEVDRAGRFHGVRKIELDMPRSDRTFLKQRLALSYMREAGVPAQCANNARLYINGEYYGLYTNLERLDKEFLKRSFPGEGDGDLWKRGRRIRTNEETASWARLWEFWDVRDFASFDAFADADPSMYEWAVEAMAGHADGYYNGRPNFFLYDHPSRGYLWIPHDVDTALDATYLPADSPPVIPSCRRRDERDWHHYLLAMADPAWTERYVGLLSVARERFDAAALQQRLDEWAAQIAEAVAEDPRRPFTLDQHARALTRMREYIAARADYIDAWLRCRKLGGPDVDGDGFDMCHDCDDRRPTVHPGAVEVCDLLDNDCDGSVDRVNGASVCPPPPPEDEPAR
jgi:hypothetical protein